MFYEMIVSITERVPKDNGSPKSKNICTSRESNAGPIDVEDINLMATMDFTTKPLVLEL